jgi:hypothetical protein
MPQLGNIKEIEKGWETLLSFKTLQVQNIRRGKKELGGLSALHDPVQNFLQRNTNISTGVLFTSDHVKLEPTMVISTTKHV